MLGHFGINPECLFFVVLCFQLRTFLNYKDIIKKGYGGNEKARFFSSVRNCVNGGGYE